MKKILYLAIPTLILCALVFLGYRMGQYTAAQQFKTIVQGMQQGETLAGALAASDLNAAQRNHYAAAYHQPQVNAHTISWSVPNQPTPFVGSAAVPGVHHNAHINAWQMRNHEVVRIPKPRGVFRIFLTGGSTAYGSGALTQEHTIGSLLQAQLNAGLAQKNNVEYEVFNFANPAWASTQERIAIENYLSELQPDMIISLSGNNDVFWGDAGRNVLWFFSFADEYFKRLANTGLVMAGQQALPELPAAIASTERITPEMVAYRIEKNARLGAQALQPNGVPWVFFLQPTLSVTQKALTARENDFLTNSREYYQQCYQAMAKKLSTLEQKNFHFVDISGVFDAYGREEELFLDQFHFGDKGNAVIADAMFAALHAILEKP